ncbi:MAG: alpha/beta hydrolase [Pseudomonadota bacterium]
MCKSSFLKTAVICVTAFIILSVVVVFAWSSTGVSVDRDTSDPGVLLANRDVDRASQYREGYFAFAGTTLHYVEAGKGDMVLFLHGFPSYWPSFQRQMEALKADYHVVAIDGLGAGKSDAPQDVEAYKLEAMADHVFALIDHLGADQVHLVGHDWGSAFAIGLAQRYPKRVKSVIAFSAPPQNVILDILANVPEERATFAYVEQFKRAHPAILLAMGIEQSIWDGAYGPLVEAGHLSEEEGALFRQATSDPKRIDAHINWYRANIPSPDAVSESDYWPARQARVVAPALYIWGSDDPIFSQLAIDKMEALSDQSELMILEDVGHWPHVERAKEVNAALRAHIAAASDTTAE